MMPGVSAIVSSSMRRQVPLLQIDAQGRVREMKLTVSALKEESRLHMRELLVLEQPSALIQARMLPRRHVIAVTVSFIRALIFPDRVYLFGVHAPHVADYAQSLGAYLASMSANQQHHAQAANGVAGGQPSLASPAAQSAANGSAEAVEEPAPFELLVMEHALLTIQQRQAKRISYAKRVLDSLLNKMGTVEKDDSRWYALFPLAQTLSHYEMASRGLCEMTRALLDDDRDMREACLTAKVKLSQRMLARAMEQARGSAAAYDPAAGDGVPTPASSLAHNEGPDAFLGYQPSPIASHKHLIGLRAESAPPAALGGGLGFTGTNNPALRSFQSSSAASAVDDDDDDDGASPRNAAAGGGLAESAPQDSGSSTASRLSSIMRAGSDEDAGPRLFTSSGILSTAGEAAPGHHHHMDHHHMDAVGAHASGHRWDSDGGGGPAAFARQPPLQYRPSATTVAVPGSHHHHYSYERDVAHGSRDHGGIGGPSAGGAASVAGLPPILQVPPDSLSQLELMLEGVYHQAAETVVQVVELSRSLRSKTELLELQQSNYR